MLLHVLAENPELPVSVNECLCKGFNGGKASEWKKLTVVLPIVETGDPMDRHPSDLKVYVITFFSISYITVLIEDLAFRSLGLTLTLGF